MADDIAALAITADSSQAVRAMDDTTASAQKMSGALDDAAMQMRNYQDVAKRTREPVEVVKKRVEDATKAANDNAAANAAAGKAQEKSNTATEAARQTHERAAKAVKQHHEELGAFGRVTEVAGKQIEELGHETGRAGQFLIALGPAGLAAAAAIGTVILAFDKMLELSKELGQRASGISGLAAATGLTAEQIQALSGAATELGISGQLVNTFFQQMTVHSVDLQKATGGVYDAVRKVSPELAKQAVNAKGAAQIIEILARAFQEAGTEGNKLLQQVGGGRGALQLGPLFSAINEAGSFEKFLAAQQKSITLTNEEVEETQKLFNTMKETREVATALFAKMFANQVLDKLVHFNEWLITTLRNFKGIQSAVLDANEALDNFIPDWLSFLKSSYQPQTRINEAFKRLPEAPASQASPSWMNAPNLLAGTGLKTTTADEDRVKKLEAFTNQYKELISVLGESATTQEKLTARLNDIELAYQKNILAIRELADEEQKEGLVSAEAYRNRARGIAILSSELDAIHQRNSAMGEATTQADKLAQKTKELDVAVAKGNITEAEAGRSRQRFIVDQQQQNLAMLQSLGVATQDQIVKEKMIALNKAEADGLRLTNDQRQLAIAIIRKEAEETYQANVVRASMVPQLQQLAFETGSLRKQLDQTAVTSLNNLSTMLVEVVTNTSNASEAFRNFGLQVAKSLADMAIKMTVIQPLAQGLASFLNPALGGGSAIGGMTAGATSAASILTTASTTMATTWIGAATESASILGVPAAALPAAGAATGAAVAEGGAASGASLAAGGAAAGASLWGPVIALGAIAASIGISKLFGKKSDEDKAAAKAAEEAAQKYKEAVDRLTTAEKAFADIEASLVPTSETAKKIKSVTDAAAELTASMAALGQDVSVVATRVAAAMDKIRKSFEEDLIAKINEATGRGFINQIRDLIKEVDLMRKDAAALGADPTLVEEYFKAQAQSIVNGAELAGDSFNDLIKMFPELTGVVVESTAAAAAAKKQLEDLGKTIREYLTGLQFGSLSILSPKERLDAAQKEFDATLAAAKAGNLEALANITKVADTLLTAAKDFYASSAGYAAIYSTVTSELGALPEVSPTSSPVGGTTATQSAKGYAQGGLVLSGYYGRDSVSARLAGGEFVTKAPSVNANTLPFLQAINRTGAVNDNQRQNFAELARVILLGLQGVERKLENIEDAYRDGTQATQDTARILANRTQRPGEKAA